MVDLIKIIILAAVQGVTEFLPISSSGHLGLAQHFIGLNPPGLIFEVTTHAGTLLAVFWDCFSYSAWRECACSRGNPAVESLCSHNH